MVIPLFVQTRLPNGNIGFDRGLFEKKVVPDTALVPKTTAADLFAAVNKRQGTMLSLGGDVGPFVNSIVEQFLQGIVCFVPTLSHPQWDLMTVAAFSLAHPCGNITVCSLVIYHKINRYTSCIWSLFRRILVDLNL
jgi:hypothetical protein